MNRVIIHYGGVGSRIWVWIHKILSAVLYPITQQKGLLMMNTPSEFEIHPQLQQDTYPVGRMALSRQLLMNDSNYPWFILVPERVGITEWFELEQEDQQLLLTESMAVSRAIREVFMPDKINVAALGNVVPQLHLHHVARYRNDPSWPAPVWGATSAVPYMEESWHEMASRLRDALGDQLSPW